MTFGERIIMLRKQLKLSQDDFAKRIGTSAPIIGGYESNKIKPSIEVVAKITDKLCVTVDYLLVNSDKWILNKKLINRIEDIEALPTEEKDKVYYFIDMLSLVIKLRRLLNNRRFAND